MRKRRKGKSKKNSKHVAVLDPLAGSTAEVDRLENGKVPKSFVLLMGKYIASLATLVRDVRSVMEPNTASKLKGRKRNCLRDFLDVAGPLGVSHFLFFQHSEHGANLRIARIPHGPTLYFRVQEYSLMRDVCGTQTHPRSPGIEFQTAPLVVMSNFEKGSLVGRLMISMFQNMFPPINPETVRLNVARRVVLFHYHTDTDSISFRQYVILIYAANVGDVCKRTLLEKRHISLRQFQEILKGSLDSPSDHVLNTQNDQEDSLKDQISLDSTNVSNPGQEDVHRPQKDSLQKKKQTGQKSVKLQELGPRMELQLLKIEQGLCKGETLYHRYVHKTSHDQEKDHVEDYWISENEHSMSKEIAPPSLSAFISRKRTLTTSELSMNGHAPVRGRVFTIRKKNKTGSEHE